MSKTVLENFEELKSSCIEALELYPRDKVQPILVRNGLKAWNAVDPTTIQWDKVYEEYSDVFNAGERQWFSDDNEMLIGTVECCTPIRIAEKYDQDLATIIIYYLYQCILSSGVVVVEDEKKRLEQVATTLKDLVNNKDTASSSGPVGIDFNALQSGAGGIPNIGNLLQTLIPTMQGMMQSTEMQDFMNVIKPPVSDTAPDIGSILNNAVSALNSNAGKKFVDRLSNDFGPLVPKNK